MNQLLLPFVIGDPAVKVVLCANCRWMCNAEARPRSSMDSIWTAGARKAAAEPEAPMTTVSYHLVCLHGDC